MRRSALRFGSTLMNDLLRPLVRSWKPRSMAVLVAMIALTPLTSMLASAHPVDALRPDPSPTRDTHFVPGHVLVGWNSPSDAEAALVAIRRSGWTVLRSLAPLPAALVSVPEGKELEAIASLRSDPAVAYAEPDILAFATGERPADSWDRRQVQSDPPAVNATGRQPNDPDWVAQWAPRRIKAPEAWELTTGSSQVVVAVVDSGINLSHPEFAGRILPGYDYVQDDNWPQDEYGHGTHVSGIIAAAGDNGSGVAGVGWQVKLLPLRVLDQLGVGSASDIASAISNAANARAQVINLSLALSNHSETVLNAIRYARGTGAIVVASAGNDTQVGQPPASVRYPARYDEVIAVSATTHWEEWAWYSNGGPEVDLAAPGGESFDPVLSTGLSTAPLWLFGTSMAAAHVSGVVALMVSNSPQTSQQAIEDALRVTADKVGSYPYSSGRNDRLGYGRIQAAAAVRRTIAPIMGFAPDTPTLVARQGQTNASTQIELTNPSGVPLQWQVTAIQPDGLTVTPTSGSGLAFPQVAKLRVGIASPPPLGLTNGSIVVRTTDPNGQRRDTVISMRVVVTQRVWSALLPAVGKRTVAPAWQDLLDGGLGLALGDDDAQPIPLPFEFPYYGRWYNQVWVHANGFLSFESGYAGAAYASNSCLPSLFSPNGAIYALWDDLDPGQGGRIVFGSTVDGGLAVEWRDVPTKVNGQLNTMQVLLYPTGQITIAYRHVGSPSTATVGLESWDASLSWQDSCNGAGMPPVSGSMRVLQAALPGQ